MARRERPPKVSSSRSLQSSVPLFVDVVEYYVPNDRMASMDFLRAVLSGQKSLLKLNQVRFLIGLEKYNELTLANLLERARTAVPRLFDYLPQDYIISRLSREYVLNVSIAAQPGHEYAVERPR